MPDYAHLRREWMHDVLGPLESKEPPRKRVPSLAGPADAAPLYGPDDLEAAGFDPAVHVIDYGQQIRDQTDFGVFPLVFQLATRPLAVVF